MEKFRYLLIDPSGDVFGTNEVEDRKELLQHFIAIIDTSNQTYSNDDFDDAEITEFKE